MTTLDFDLSTDGSSTASTTNDDSEVDPDFQSNETGDLYLGIGDTKAIAGEPLSELPVPDDAKYTKTVEDDDGNEEVQLAELKIYSDDTLEDAGRLLEKYSDAIEQQRLHMVFALAKSTLGKMQRDNSHSIGLTDDGKAPEEHYEESCSYALWSKDLPTIHWEGLDGGERDGLEDLGVDPSAVGFDAAFGGPKIPVIDGERLPIFATEGAEAIEAAEMMLGLPDEPSAYTDDGFQESSDPSVFDGEVDTEKGGSPSPSSSEESKETDDEWNSEVNFAEEPERIGEALAENIKADATNIDSLRTIKTLRREEMNHKDRGSVLDRLRSRKSAIESEREAEDDDDDEEDNSLEDIVEMFDLSDIQTQAVRFRVNEDKADSYEEAAEQMIGS